MSDPNHPPSPSFDTGSKPSSKRLPGLDGLRAVAVILVFLAHYYHGSAQGALFERVAYHGGFGVIIFFVLSGYLITHLLLVEESSQGTISIPLFYARRALRILPPLVVFLCFLFAASKAGAVHVPAIDFAAGMLFFRNFAGHSRETGHLWTLAIEEQFYLAWPLILVFLRHRRARLLFCLAIVVGSPFWRVLVSKISGGGAAVNHHRTDLTLDPLVAGALLALLLSEERWRRFLTRGWVRSGWVATAALIVLGVVQLSGWFETRVFHPFQLSVSIFCVGVIINCLVHFPMTRLAAIFEIGAIAWVGRLSYSLYLWQQLFAPRIPGIEPRWFREFPINLGFGIGLAILSYYLVEQPLLKYRHRLKHVGKSNDAELSKKSTVPEIAASPAGFP